MDKIHLKIVLSLAAGAALLLASAGICLAQTNDASYRKGIYFKRYGEYDRAVEAFTQAIRNNPSHARAYDMRGAVWFIKKEYKKALADYTRAIELDPDTASFYRNRAAAFFKTGRIDKTITDYNTAVRLDPGHSETYHRRGMVRYFNGEYELAVNDQTLAILLSPEIWRYYNSRGSAWFRKKEYNRAVTDYSSALALDPLSFNTLKNRGIAWLKKGLYDHAVVDFTNALKLHAQSVEVLVSRGIAYYQKGEYDNALTDFVDAVSVEPDNPEALRQLAWMLAVCPVDDYRNGEKAVEMAMKAIKLLPRLDMLDTLSAAFAEAGDYNQAVLQQEKLVQLLKGQAQEVPPGYIEKLEAYKAGKPWRANLVYPELEQDMYPTIKRVARVSSKVRIQPDPGSIDIESLEKGRSLTILGQDGPWLFVQIGVNRFGWVSPQVFTPVKAVAEPEFRTSAPVKAPEKAPAVVQVPDEVLVSVTIGRIRSGPSADSGVLYKVVRGNHLAVLERKNDWIRVILGPGKTGWGHKSLFE